MQAADALPLTDLDLEKREDMSNLLHTNVAVYRAIADEAFHKMVASTEAGRRPNPNGGNGWILTYDPTHTSFKQAMITIVFTGIWLEAILHLLIVKAHGPDKFKECDFKSYEKKLELLGLTDKALLNSISQFRKARKELVHEKAHLDDGEIRTAQKEAENAHALLTTISQLLVEQREKPGGVPIANTHR